MSQLATEHQVKVYRPEDIGFRDGTPFLEITLGQIVLELALKNVGSEEEPVWIAWFDPRVEEVRNAGVSALVEMLSKIDDVVLALTPFSFKSGPMINDACKELNLPILTLQGSHDLEELKSQVGGDEKIYGYHPITSQNKPKYLAFGKEVRNYIASIIKLGKKIVIVDDVYSSGNTIKTILLGLKDILGSDLYAQAQIEVVTVAREGVIHNGAEVPLIDIDQDLIYDVYIPEVIGDLNAAVNK